MRRQHLALGLLGWLARAAAWNHTSPSALGHALASSGYTLIAFILPSQEASKDLETEWASLQETQEDENIVSFDCAANLKVCKDLDVVSFPAIRLYHRDGRMDRYRGERKERKIKNFLYRALRPTILEASQRDSQGFFTLDDVVFILHLHHEDTHLYERYKALAERYRDRYSFGISGPIKDKSAIGCNNKIDDERFLTTELSSVQALEDFVKQCSEPLIPELTRMNEEEYNRRGKSLLHYFATTAEEKEQYRNDIRPLAKKYNEFLIFTITDANEYPELLTALGLDQRAKEGIALENPNNGDVFPYKGGKKISTAAVDKFVNDVVDGKIMSLKGPSGQNGKHDEL